MNQGALISGLFWILNVISYTGGLYFLEVRLHGYSNPTGTCKDCVFSQTPDPYGCCDRHNTTECSNFLCDTYFDYCLRPLGSKEDGAGGCSYSGYVVSNSNRDDRFINFSQSTVLGLDNPLILPGLTDDWNGVQLFINAVDNDTNLGNDDDLVDTLLVDHNLPVEKASVRMNYTGIYGLLTMDLTLRAVCAENFTGTDCSQCVPGFTGARCDIQIDSEDFISYSSNPFIATSTHQPVPKDLQTQDVPVGTIAGIVVSVSLLVVVLLSVVAFIVHCWRTKIRAKTSCHQSKDSYDNNHDLKESNFKMENNIVYEVSTKMPGLEMRENEAYTAMPGLELRENEAYTAMPGLEVRENEAYTAISELQENFDMNKSICYAVTEPKSLH